MVSYFDSNENANDETVTLNMNGFNAENGVKAKYYLIDEEHDLDLVKEEVLSGGSLEVELSMPIYSSYLVMLEKN